MYYQFETFKFLFHYVDKRYEYKGMDINNITFQQNNQYWICDNCKRANIIIAKFCGKCGKKYLHKSNDHNCLSTNNISNNYNNSDNVNNSKLYFINQNSEKKHSIHNDLNNSNSLTNDNYSICKKEKANTSIQNIEKKYSYYENSIYKYAKNKGNEIINLFAKYFTNKDHFLFSQLAKFAKVKTLLKFAKIIGFIIFLSIFLRNTSFTFEKNWKETNSYNNIPHFLGIDKNFIHKIFHGQDPNTNNLSSNAINNTSVKSCSDTQNTPEINFLIDYVSPEDVSNAKVVLNYLPTEMCWIIDFIGIKAPPIAVFQDHIQNINFKSFIKSVRLDKIYDNPNVYRLSIYTNIHTKLITKQLSNSIFCKLLIENSHIEKNSFSQPLLSPSNNEYSYASATSLFIDIHNSNPIELLQKLASNANINLKITSSKIKKIDKISVKSNYGSPQEAILEIANKLKLQIIKEDDRNWIIR